ncbi:MAG: CHAT domain-containing protein [Pyrinomonadaceae bacterium]|nr:CHAT domain-containing protein [Pyrinomonadaceae bacterium]
MNENPNNLETIRQYLLGCISDEKTLEGIEELLFSDEDFCTKAEIVEDDLINDFVFGKLNAEDNLSFAKTLENNTDRRAKVKVTQLLKAKTTLEFIKEKPTIFESIKGFLRQPIYIGGLALLLIVILFGAFIIFRSNNNPELAQLKNIYQKNRPTESRVSEFDYAPYQVTRGENDLTDAEIRKLKIIENDLLKKVDSNPNANNHNALGIFYLSQRKYSEAIKELEESVKLEPNNAKFHNDLGSAYFELGKFDKEKALENFARANESFSKSWELNSNLLEALFNKALVLQSLNLQKTAKENWELYLQKDSTSKWADEARKYLEKLAKAQSRFKTKEQVLEDFLAAYQNGNEKLAWEISCQTKEMLTGVWLPQQLSQRYLLNLKNKGEPIAKNSIEALKYLGNLEKNRNDDYFVNELAGFYQKIEFRQIDEMLQAKNLLREGYELAPQANFQDALKKFETAKNLFNRNGNHLEAKIAEYWIAFCLADMAQLRESELKLGQLKTSSENQKFKWLEVLSLMRLSDIAFRKNELSKAIVLAKNVLKMAEETNDTIYIQRGIGSLAFFYDIFGESKKSVAYLSKLLTADELYFQGYFQHLRNLGSLFEKNKASNFRQSSVDYAIELNKITNENPTNLALIFDSESVLAEMFLKNNEFQKAEQSIQTAHQTAEQIDDKESKSIKMGYLDLLQASLKLKMGKNEAALGKYQEIIDRFSGISEYIPDLFSAHKGKLICLRNLSRYENFESELNIVSELIQKYRDKILEEENRNSFFDREQSVVNLAIDFYLQKNDTRQSFEFAEKSKSRSLLDLIENKGIYSETEKQIVFQKSENAFNIEQIQSQLANNVQIVQYAVLDNKVVVWLIENDKFEMVATTVLSELLEQKVKNYLELMKTKSPELKPVSKELYEILIKPILGKLNPSKQICIVPDGILYYLPFISLVSPESEKYLIEGFTVFYAPSATTFILLSKKAQNKPSTENLFAIGNPNFNKENNNSLPLLPEAENEVKEISYFYPTVKVLLGNEAIKSKVLKNLEEADIFHFAGHYVVNQESALNSKLLLAQPKYMTDEFEGELRASEILERKLSNLKLAILSACDTGIERFYFGEGAIGIGRMFLAKGIPLVVVSQWKVESESTSELMKVFHRNRKQKQMKTVESLRQAQLEMLANKTFSAPYYWSSFAVVGGNADY